MASGSMMGSVIFHLKSWLSPVSFILIESTTVPQSVGVYCLWYDTYTGFLAFHSFGIMSTFFGDYESILLLHLCFMAELCICLYDLTYGSGCMI